MLHQNFVIPHADNFIVYMWKLSTCVIRIELQTSPSSSVILSDNVSHLHSFEIRHCVNPCAKKVAYYPDVLQSLKLQNEQLHWGK